MKTEAKQKFITKKAELLTALLDSPIPYTGEGMSENAMMENDREMDELIHQLSQHPSRKFAGEIKKLHETLRAMFGITSLA